MNGNYTVTSDVQVPMRDGTKLATDLYRPDVDAPVPTLLVRNPYDKYNVFMWGSFAPNWFALVRAGYAVAIQDTRGIFASEGEFEPHRDDFVDGEDTVNWLAEQDWCDGNIGMFGISYLGITQWQLAATGVPGLKAIAPSFASADLYRSPWHSPGGALGLEVVLGWAGFVGCGLMQRQLATGEGDLADLLQLASIAGSPSTAASVTPVADQPLLRRVLPWMIDHVINHPERDEFWQHISALDRVDSITAPALITAGWYDVFIGESLRAYTETKDRAGAHLIVGPWSHDNVTGRNFHRKFGPTAAYAAIDTTTINLAFFDHHLRGQEGALAQVPRVRIFVMGIDEWRDEPDWPLPDTLYTPFYLDGDGAANTIAGAGALATAVPSTAAVDTYLYDPTEPVPTLGGTLVFLEDSGPVDQSPIHGRDDVLCFATPPLVEPLEVTGPVTATLFVSSTAVDTDFSAKLVDIHPDGRAINLCDGILRMRYRNSLTEPTLIEPDTIYEISIDLLATSNTFLPGHRLLVEISSSNFPRYDRNSNTGGVIAHEHLDDMQPAVNRLYRGPEHPSRIILPVIDRKRVGAL